MMLTIKQLKAREILDSRGNPTVEAELTLSDGQSVTAAVPSGASTGSHEAWELRDGDKKRYQGKGVLQAVAHIEEEIAQVICGQAAQEQVVIDEIMIELDGTENKSRLGANAILAVSMAVARGGALAAGQPLYQYLAGLAGNKKLILPMPFINMINGGAHAGFATDIQEYMVVPVGAPNFAEAIRYADEVFKALQALVKKQGLGGETVGDEGGLVPHCQSNEQPLELLLTAIEQAGYQPGKQVALALDAAATEFFAEGQYKLAAQKETLDAAGLIAWYEQLAGKYPLISLEDGLAEDDWAGWQQLTKQLGGRLQLVGDDLFVTNQKRLQQGIKQKAANAVLIKLNQIGTLSETLVVIKEAQAKDYACMISHRSGETSDSFIADLAVGTGVGQIKSGSLTRSERLAKYNQLMRIEEELGKASKFAGKTILKR